MPIHTEPHAKAGTTVSVDLHNHDDVERVEYQLEDWWDRVSGQSWIHSDGNPAAMIYGMRSGFAGLPTDNDVVYGKIGGMGHLVHVSEIVAED